MSKMTSTLDKTYDSTLDELGSMSIRVIVLSKRNDEADDEDGQVPMDLGEDEVQATTGKTPTRTYLEDLKRGKECCVFLIYGQRQDAWDNTFIVRDLGKKYLRNRMLVAVDLDGLKPEATADLMSGDRQGFFQGKVYQAMSSRLIATLKRDPDLERLEEEAERELSELRSGDEAVKKALDQLIDSHHAKGDHFNTCAYQPGEGKDRGPGVGVSRAQNVVVGPTKDGEVVDAPYLLASPPSQLFRLHPDESSSLVVTTSPIEEWANTSELQIVCKPEIEGLEIDRTRTDRGEKLSLTFKVPEDFEDDQYPVESLLSITAHIAGHDEPRHLDRRIVIGKKGVKSPPPPPPILLDEPTFLKVTSRQPIPLVASGAATHVRLRWDGKDELAMGNLAPWKFSAKCLTEPAIREMSFSRPSAGRFELLVIVPSSISLSDSLEFEVTATGPGGKTLAQKFMGQVMAPPQPKRLKKVLPIPSAQRRPPYDLKYVKENNWEAGYLWSEDERWTAGDVGTYSDPSDSSPLTLIINEDMVLLKEYQDGLISRKLEASTVKERVTHYTSHVAFHLYQMYLHAKDAKTTSEEESKADLQYDAWRGEINRVGRTLLKVMSVTK
ncbi:MAG: hypothetical protein HY273_06525 [Gammaproteobacteria bacterium]|nr:hypothetical protein [Gammaproteobacteria bacterium]